MGVERKQFALKGKKQLKMRS